MLDSDRVVVVGTGPAGAAAAVFLERAGLQPLVLEAGRRESPLGFTARLRGVTVAKKKAALTHRTDLDAVADPRAELFETLAPGGLSNHWACAVPRFSPDDFADARRGGEAMTWPVDYAELAPWYAEVEALLAIAGSEKDVPNLPAGRVRVRRSLGPAWDHVASEVSASGRDLAVMPYAYGGDTTFTAAATPFNAYTRLVKPAERRGGLSVRYGLEARSLHYSTSEKRVTEVVCRDTLTGAEERVPCRAVVLAAGAVNSAQILLESRSPDFPSGLGNSHGVLGRYLHDHPLAKLVLDVREHLPIAPAVYVTRPSLERTTPLYAAAFMQWTGVFAMARSLAGGHPGRSRSIGFSIFGTMPPTPDDFVELDGARAGNGRSRVRYALRHPPEAIRLLEESRNELVSSFERAGLRPFVRVFRVEAPGVSVHYGGTCRMHASPKYGVVDSHSRVFDVRNVAVADSSVFTTGPEKNPVLTAMTLAARASDRLAAEIRSGDL